MHQVTSHHQHVSKPPNHPRALKCENELAVFYNTDRYFKNYLNEYPTYCSLYLCMHTIAYIAKYIVAFEY